jgi:predicted nucleic acid-binding protein
MIFDTDILIWVEKDHPLAHRWVDHAEERFVSIQTYLELLQTAKDRAQQVRSQRYLKDLQFQVLPITENISHRAMTFMREYGLSHGLEAGDCLIAATAAEHRLPLATGNAKHFRAIKDLELKVFKP